MTDTLAELKAARDAASKADRAAQDRVRTLANKAAYDAETAVRDAHAAELSALRKRASKTNAAYEQAVSAAASHPLEGRTIVKVEARRWGGGGGKVRGIIKVYRQGDPLPANQRWGLPNLGEAYVVAIKKDGTPGTRILDRLLGDKLAPWELEKSA